LSEEQISQQKRQKLLDENEEKYRKIQADRGKFRNPSDEIC
jgi:hypothetical protein